MKKTIDTFGFETMEVIENRPYKRGMKVAYVGGTFDLMHAGHIELFQKVKKVFDYLIVSVNTDEFTTKFKRKPVITLERRMQSIAALSCVDMVVENIGGASSGKTIDALLKPQMIIDTDGNQVCLPIHAIVHGADWTGDDYMKQLGITQSWLDERNIILMYVDYSKADSTSSIIERCKKV